MIIDIFLLCFIIRNRDHNSELYWPTDNKRKYKMLVMHPLEMYSHIMLSANIFYQPCSQEEKFKVNQSSQCYEA